MYTISGVVTTLTTAKTLAYITAPSGEVVEILWAKVTMYDETAAEQIRCAFQRISSLGTPTATSVTPSPHEAGDQAAGSTCAVNVTASEPTYSAGVLFGQDGALSTSGWYWRPDPEDRVYVSNGASIGLKSLDTVGDSDWNVTICFREIG